MDHSAENISLGEGAGLTRYMGEAWRGAFKKDHGMGGLPHQEKP